MTEFPKLVSAEMPQKSCENDHIRTANSGKSLGNGLDWNSKEILAAHTTVG